LGKLGGQFDFLKDLNDINYNAFSKIDRDGLSYLGLLGVQTWCNHSDCDGNFSIGMVCDIVVAFEKVYPFIEYTVEEKEWAPEWMDQLKALMEKALELKSIVIFG